MRTRQVVAAGDEWRDETIAAMPEPTDQTRCTRAGRARRPRRRGTRERRVIVTAIRIVVPRSIGVALAPDEQSHEIDAVQQARGFL